jgi:hypothetical protein
LWYLALLSTEQYFAISERIPLIKKGSRGYTFLIAFRYLFIDFSLYQQLGTVWRFCIFCRKVQISTVRNILTFNSEIEKKISKNS